MSESVIGVDASTTSVKAIAWSRTGVALAEARAGYPLSNPAPDAWEQDPEAWWTATQGAIAGCTHALGTLASQVRAVCIANQRETVVVCDGEGVPLHPALVWMDSRGKDRVTAAIATLGEERAHRISGKPACITPSLYKLFALYERHPELRREDTRVLDVHGWLAQKLTGRFATSLAAADPLGLVDMAARRWSPELLALLGHSERNVPELCEPGEHLGEICTELCGQLGLPIGTPLIAGAGDGQAAGLGAGIESTGRAYLNLGTAIVSGVLSAEYLTDRAFRTLYGATPGSYFLETDLKGGTFTLSWFAERWLCREAERLGVASVDTGRVLADLEQRAAMLPPGAGGLLAVPYWNGVMNPYWDDDATGVVVGFQGGHGPEHLHRALLEGIAFEQQLHSSAVEQALGTRIDEVVVMGGGSQSDLWCQILAEVLRRPVVRAGTAEATSLGAGVLAAASVGLHPDVKTATAHMTHTGQRFLPGPAAERYAEFAAVYATLYPSLRDALGSLARLQSSGS